MPCSKLFAAMACIAAVVTASPLNVQRSSAVLTCSSVSPAPSGSTCGQHGKVSKPAVLSTDASIKTSNDCETACGGNSSCQAFSFAGKKCTLYSATAKQMKFKMVASSMQLFTDRACFSCMDCTTTPLSNGNFETGSLSPWFGGSSTASYMPANFSVVHPPQNKPSTWVARLDVAKAAPSDDDDEVTYSDAQLIQRFNLCPGKYRLDFDYAISFSDTTTNFGQDLAVFVISTTGGGPSYAQYGASGINFNNAGQFYHASADFELDTPANIFNIRYYNYNQTNAPYLLVDNVSVVST